MKITGYQPLITEGPLAADQKPEKIDFGDILAGAVNNVDKVIKKAGMESQNLASGRHNRIHETMMAMEEADISMKMFLAVRNKLLEGFKEITRMQM